MKSAPFFQNPITTREALARYAEFAKEMGWPITEKLDLYRRATTAFAGAADEHTKRQNHAFILQTLVSYWKVNRNGTMWDATTLYDALAEHCQPCSRGNRLDLATAEFEQHQDTIVSCLEAMRSLKRLRSGNYPVMAVSKNLHFFNPRLFVIYDRAVVVGIVYPAFKNDWNDCYHEFNSTGDEWLDCYVTYLRWAGRMIRNSYPGLMHDFANWFIQTVADVGEDAENFRDELQVSFATAFEFIMIGAAHLEGAGVPCLSR